MGMGGGDMRREGGGGPAASWWTACRSRNCSAVKHRASYRYAARPWGRGSAYRPFPKPVAKLMRHRVGGRGGGHRGKRHGAGSRLGMGMGMGATRCPQGPGRRARHCWRTRRSVGPRTGSRVNSRLARRDRWAALGPHTPIHGPKKFGQPKCSVAGRHRGDLWDSDFQPPH